ncbi:MAG TPA: dienelactone hydrolase family protein [Sphingobacteriaceae bacterium]
MYTHTKQIFQTGQPLRAAESAIVMLHGRGANAGGISSLANELNLKKPAVLAPMATQSSWYPYSFLAPAEDNQPALDSALNLVAEIVEDILFAGLPLSEIYFLGFSQGACMALEYAARNPHRYGGVIAFTGGLIGDRILPDSYHGDFSKMPVLITSGDPDPHVPLGRVEESAALFRKMNARVTLKVFKGRAHTIQQEEIDLANKLVLGSG